MRSVSMSLESKKKQGKPQAAENRALCFTGRRWKTNLAIRVADVEGREASQCATSEFVLKLSAAAQPLWVPVKIFHPLSATRPGNNIFGTSGAFRRECLRAGDPGSLGIHRAGLPCCLADGGTHNSGVRGDRKNARAHAHAHPSHDGAAKKLISVWRLGGSTSSQVLSCPRKLCRTERESGCRTVNRWRGVLGGE